jgi:two-component system sensor histidine kinase/response regulator
MPDIDGFETTRRVRQAYSQHARTAPPIIALTANAFSEDRKRCLASGLDDFMAKPFDRSDLENMIAKWYEPRNLEGTGRRDGRAA